MTRGAFASLFALALAGCTVDPDPGERRVAEEPYVRPSTVVQSVGIVQGAPLVAAPGEGAGVFVEYRGQGDWYVWTACDTKLTKLDCVWDLYFSPISGAIDSAQPPLGQTGGGAITLSSGRAELHATNTYGTDGVTFHVTPPASAVRIEAWLDGKADPRVLYWTGPDVIHEGAPSNPVDFVPTDAAP